MSMKSLLNYYFAIQHSHYRNHLQKYYRFNIKNEWKNTLTTREHGLGELQDQATSLLLVFVVGVGHIIEARVVAEERSDLFVLLVCERLWEFRASGVFIGTVCTFLTCRRFISYTSPGRRWLFSPCFTCFPALGLLLLSWGYILWEKYEYYELSTVLPPWGLWVLWAPPTRVLDLYAVRDPECKSADPRAIIRCNRSIIRRRLTDDRAGITRWPPGMGPL